MVVSDLFEKLHSGNARHDKVRYNAVRFHILDLGQGLLGGIKSDDLVTRFLEKSRLQLDHKWVVVDH
jgi:hypothetical protein